MTIGDVHICPRCELRFTHRVELEDHLRHDHDVDLSEGAVADAGPVRAPSTTGTITIPVDPAHDPSMAVSVGSTLAAQAGMSVDIVAVPAVGLPTATTDAYLRARTEEAASIGAVATWHDLGAGRPSDAILAHVAESGSDLICMATRSRGAIGEFLLGSVSESVLRNSPVPVVLVGPETRPCIGGFDRLLAAVDGSELAEQALDVGVDLRSRIGGDLYLVEVVDPVELPPDVSESNYLFGLAGRLDPAPTSFDVYRSEHPPDAILDAVDKAPCTILVMGTHGIGGLRRLVMGSVALEVVRHTWGPVLVLPISAARRLVAT